MEVNKIYDLGFKKMIFYNNKKREEGNKKILVLIDYANIKAWFVEKNFYIDLAVLKKALDEIGVLETRFYYGFDSKNKKFFEFIKNNDFVLITKPVQYTKIKFSSLVKQKNNKFLLKNLSKNLQKLFKEEMESSRKEDLFFLQTKANFDVEITLDALEKIDEYDTLVLFSGDGDFVPLVEKVQKKSKKVVALSGRKYFSGILRKKIDTAISMELLIKVLPDLVCKKMQKPADEQQVFNKCSLSIATRKRLSSLLGVKNSL